MTPKSYLPLFVNEADRAYFSKPVAVVPLYSTLDRLLWVNDPATGHSFPVKPANVKRSWQLTNRQRAAGGVK